MTSRRSTPTMGISTFTTLLCLFWLFSSTALAVNAVLGVDFGTEYIKATLVKPGIPLEIVLTKDTRRKETSAVAFKPIKNAKPGDFPERVYGSDAIALAARFPGDIYPNLKALLGLPAGSSKVLEYSARRPALKFEGHAVKGTVAFRSGAFSPDEEPFMVEEIIAMELQSIQKNAEAMAGKGSTIKDIVITVPPYFSVEEKRAIEFAADLAGLRVLSLTSDGLAVGLNYATTRTFPSVTDGGKPEHHLVFDMGAGSTKATVLKFQGRTVKDVGKFNKTIQEVQVLGTGWDRTLGGDTLNAVIVDDMVANFVSSKAAKAASVSIESVQAHGRAAAKLWKEAERIRQVLSANTESQASFEGLYEDIDFRYKLNRATFEKLAEAHAARIWPAIEKALLRAHIGIEELDSVILHGGAVRTPFVQKQLETIFGKSDKIRSNVNPDEAAVFGAGFKGAELSPSFRVKEIKTYDVAGYAVGMMWTNVHGKGQHQQIFNPESQMGKVKTVSFQNQQDFPITFYQHVGSSEDVSPGAAEKEIMRVSMTNLTASVAQLKEKHGCTDGDILMKLSVRLNPDDLETQITKAVLQCETEEEEKKDSMVDNVMGLFGFGSKKGDQEVLDGYEQIQASGSESASSSSSSTSETASPSASASPAAKDGKPKTTKRLVEIPLTFETERLGYPQLEAKDVLRIKERLVAFDDSDRSRRLREESLNQLEGFTYRARDMINDDSFIEMSTEAERSALEEKVKAAGEWLYDDGADASQEELKSKLKEMKDIVGPIEKRKEEASQRPAKIQSMKDALNSTLAFIDSMKSQIKAAEAISSSLASESSSSTTTAEPSSTTSNEFEGLEDEETTSSTTKSSKASQSTPPMPHTMPQYTKEDLDEVVAIYETVKAWFVAKLAEQEALPPTADPVLLVAEIQAKSQELTTASMNVIMKAMKVPERERGQWGDYGGGGSSSNKSKSKTKTASSKNKKAKSTKSKSSKGPKSTEINLGDGKKKTMFEMNADMSEEEIAAALEAQFGVGFDDLAGETKEKETEKEKEKEHKIDEL
jgi:hypoxia up-regulated 1